jgi:hypothetical protein
MLHHSLCSATGMPHSTQMRTRVFGSDFLENSFWKMLTSPPSPTETEEGGQRFARSVVRGRDNEDVVLHRRLRLRVLQALETRARQFRSREDVWPFRVPHEPLALEPIVEMALDGEAAAMDAQVLRWRPVLTLQWTDGPDEWEAWALTLPSGVQLYGDRDGGETRVLASVKRGSTAEADRFFLERLGESRGHAFGIELGGSVPDRVRTSVDDRDLIADVFVDLFEATPAERAIQRLLARRDLPAHAHSAGRDFRADVMRWLEVVLVAPPAPARPGRRRPVRLRDMVADRR